MPSSENTCLAMNLFWFYMSKQAIESSAPASWWWRKTNSTTLGKTQVNFCVKLKTFIDSDIILPAGSTIVHSVSNVIPLPNTLYAKMCIYLFIVSSNESNKLLLVCNIIQWIKTCLFHHRVFLAQHTYVVQK